MRILLLGGTADARQLADALIQQGHEVIYSIAGLVRTPKLTCEILVGGFSQFGGLTAYLQHQKEHHNNIDMLLDATHPYAQKMSDQAVCSAEKQGIHCWRFSRPQWTASSNDHWYDYHDFSDLLTKLTAFNTTGKTLLLTAGQFSEAQLLALATLPFRQILFRTAVAPSFSYDKLQKVRWIKAIGPFSEQDEKALIEGQGVDIIVSKNSGGNATVAKLLVAQALTLPVFMQVRPALMCVKQEFFDLQSCLQAVRNLALTSM